MEERKQREKRGLEEGKQSLQATPLGLPLPNRPRLRKAAMDFFQWVNPPGDPVISQKQEIRYRYRPRESDINRNKSFPPHFKRNPTLDHLSHWLSQC